MDASSQMAQPLRQREVDSVRDVLCLGDGDHFRVFHFCVGARQQRVREDRHQDDGREQEATTE